MPLFETRGLWAEAFARVDKLRTKARNRKKKYHRLLREVRESTGALADGGIILNADNEIMWFNPAARALARAQSRDRRRSPHRQPAAPSRLRRRTSAAPTGDGITVASPRSETGWLHVQIIPYGTGPTARDHPRRDEREERRAHAPRFRRECVARAAFAADRHQRLSRGLATMPAMSQRRGRRRSREMQRQAERMTRILRDLIELTRLESAERERRSSLHRRRRHAEAHRAGVPRPAGPDRRARARDRRGAARQGVGAAFDFLQPHQQRRAFHAADGQRRGSSGERPTARAVFEVVDTGHRHTPRSRFRA